MLHNFGYGKFYYEFITSIRFIMSEFCALSNKADKKVIREQGEKGLRTFFHIFLLSFCYKLSLLAL